MPAIYSGVMDGDDDNNNINIWVFKKDISVLYYILLYNSKATCFQILNPHWARTAGWINRLHSKYVSVDTISQIGR